MAGLRLGNRNELCPGHTQGDSHKLSGAESIGGNQADRSPEDFITKPTVGVFAAQEDGSDGPA